MGTCAHVGVEGEIDGWTVDDRMEKSIMERIEERLKEHKTHEEEIGQNKRETTDIKSLKLADIQSPSIIIKYRSGKISTVETHLLSVDQAGNVWKYIEYSCRGWR